MAAITHIRYIRRGDIDTAKWDASILNASNGLLYATSAWLDNMSRHWDALILGDYELVMPLTWKNKWGLRYLYQPPLSLQLGIFGNTSPTQTLIDAFIEKTKQKFRFAEIFLNNSNAHPRFPPHRNYELYLNHPHATLVNNYKKDLHKNLHRSHRFMLLYTSSPDHNPIIDRHRQQYGALTPHVTPRDYEGFKNYCRLADKKGELILRNVSTEDGRLMSEALLLRYKNRLHLLMTSTPAEGRKTTVKPFFIG